ncbi:MAG: hypothetical protein IJE43_08660 [Alphaproteobacteria bacterium]|nr:hypothetical protein [Alphaproteobacteria bacterium]
MWETKKCIKCLSKELVTFTDLDIIKDVAYRRTECAKCGYWEIRDHKHNLIQTGSKD